MARKNRKMYHNTEKIEKYYNLEEGKEEKKTSVYLAVEIMKRKLQKGRKKHADKLRNHGKPLMNVIYSAGTIERYIQACVKFIKDTNMWLGYSLEDPMEYRPFVEEWLAGRIEAGYAASTIHTEAAALAKLFGCHMYDFDVDRPKRKMTDFTLHRGDAWKEKYNPFEHTALEVVCHGTGLRRCEVYRLRPEQVVYRRDDGVYIEGIKGKGGRERDIKVLEEFGDAVYLIAEYALAASKEHLTETPPKYAPIHQHRGWYARLLYETIARPAEKLSRKEKYRSRIMRCTYDRAAMQVVSEMLGHTRLCVVINYF